MPRARNTGYRLIKKKGEKRFPKGSKFAKSQKGVQK